MAAGRWPQMQQVQRAVATRDRADEHFGLLAARTGLLDQPIARTNSIGPEHADAKDFVLANE